MEKERKIKVLSLAALIVAILGLTVAFASLSEKLTINGSATVDAATWDVHFTDNVETMVFGDATITTPPEVQTDTLHVKNFAVTLTKPGDGVRFDFKVINDGTITAKQNQIIIYNGLSIETSTEEQIFKSIFAEADWDGDGVTTDEEIAKAMEFIYFTYEFKDMYLGAGDCYYLEPGKTGKIVIKIAFHIDATELPKGNIKLNLNMDFPFEQA